MNVFHSWNYTIVKRFLSSVMITMWNFLCFSERHQLKAGNFIMGISFDRLFGGGNRFDE